MAPIESFLNESDIETAKEILSTKPPSIYPDLFETTKDEIFSSIPQIEFLLVSIVLERVIMERVLMDDDQFNSFSAGNDKQPNTSYCSIAITHLHPLSRGSIVSITRFEGGPACSTYRSTLIRLLLTTTLLLTPMFLKLNGTHGFSPRRPHTPAASSRRNQCWRYSNPTRFIPGIALRPRNSGYNM